MFISFSLRRKAFHGFGVIMMLFMYALETLVAFVQAYVFTMLSAVFIGQAHKEHHAE